MKKILKTLFISFIASLSTQAQDPFPLPSTQVYGSFQAQQTANTQFVADSSTNNFWQTPQHGFTNLAPDSLFGMYYGFSGENDTMYSFDVYGFNDFTTAEFQHSFRSTGFETSIGVQNSVYGFSVIDSLATIFNSNFQLVDIDENPVMTATKYGEFNQYGPDYTLMNDTFSFGPFNVPLAGVANTFGTGIFTNAVGDFSAIGGGPREVLLGYTSTTGANRISVDTSDIFIRSDSTLSLYSTNANVEIQADSVFMANAQREFYVRANADSEDWEYGVTGFSNSATCCNRSTTVYALYKPYLLDVNVLNVTPNHIDLTNRYGVTGANDWNRNIAKIDSSGISLHFGERQLGSSPPPSIELDINVTGVKINTTEGFFYAPRMTATQAAVLTPEDGAQFYATDTNGTFTQIGLWAYINGTWTALH